MKSFFWKTVICVVPCALALWVTIDAVTKYIYGESGGFKLGTDLVGGTILVYEIDWRKTTKETDTKKKKDEKEGTKKAAAQETWDPNRDIGVLAEALKRRIDPNDLKNIIIRPSGGEGRVEIILPTGGTHRAEVAAKKWQTLLQEVADEFGAPLKQVEVGRGRVLELADRIQRAQADTIWRNKLFNDEKSWNRLVNSAMSLNAWPKLGEDKETKAALEALANDAGQAGNLPKFTDTLFKSLERLKEQPSEKAIHAWLKQQAWEEMMVRATEKWPDLKLSKEEQQRLQALNPLSGKTVRLPPEMEAIAPDSTEQLVTYIAAKGNVVGQGALAMLTPLVGSNIYGTVDPDEVRRFIRANYGPSIPEIIKAIEKYSQESGYSKDVSIEDVQRVKDLVAKVGRLEFRIVANSNDDKEAIADAKRMLNEDWKSNPELEKEIKDAQSKGLPLPAPREADGSPKKYTINLANRAQSVVTYSWVELGPLERHTLKLDNASRTDPQRMRVWNDAATKRDKADTLIDPYTTGTAKQEYLLQGALFYSRKCEDRNIPEEERRKKEYEYFVLCRDPEFDQKTGERTRDIDGGLMSSAYPDRDQVGRPIVGFSFGTLGAELFGTLTRKNVAEGTGPESTKKLRYLAIVLDGLIMSAPTINSEIRDRGQISGSFTQKQVEELVNILRAGRLPATLKPQPVSESTIGATLGEDTINRGVIAVLIAFAAILVFMVVYYRFAGFVACVALLANLLLTVGFMVFVQATFTLPGLAGLVLMLGMAVDANILIYERLREERERGASLALAIRNGYDRALPTIIDTHLTGIFTAVVLYIVGNDQLKGFGVSLTVGLIISLFTSLYMTRVMFDYWLSRHWLHKLSMLRLFAKPDLDFMGIRYLMFTVTAVVSIIGIALFIGRLPSDLNIDFVGGTAYGGKLAKAVSIEDLRKLLDEKHQENVLGTAKNPKIQVAEEAGGDHRLFLITYPSGDKRSVSLANPPGDITSDAWAQMTAEERSREVLKHAVVLPDPAIELIFTQSQQGEEGAKGIDSSHSDQFVVRTSQREVELVQSSLDQLLRDENGKPLLKKILVKTEPLDRQRRETRLRFFDEATGKKTSGSPSFIKTLLTREVRKELGIVNEAEPTPFIIEVTGEGQGETDGSYHVVKVAFSDLKEHQISAVEAALRDTERAFGDRPQPDRLENFDSQLATDTRYRAMAAIIASWAGILVYLWFRFGSWTFGLAAVLCLVHDLFFTLGCIAGAHYLHGTWIGDNILRLEDFKLDLPAVAALLTLVGYSVSDTIVVFDRIREVRGKNPDLTPKMINDSVNQTLSRTVLASLSVWLVVFVLYWFGGPGVHLFGFVMVVGVLVGTYSSIYIASPLLLLFGEGRHEEAKAVREAAPPAAETGIRPGMAR